MSRGGAGGASARPFQAGARGTRDAGRLGHGPGWLWPWPRRPGVRGVAGSVHASATGSSREGHGSVTELASRGRERGKSTLPCVLGNSHFSAAVLVGAIATVRAAAAFPALI